MIVEEPGPAAVVNATMNFAEDHRVILVVPGFELFTHIAAPARTSIGSSGAFTRSAGPVPIQVEAANCIGVARRAPATVGPLPKPGRHAPRRRSDGLPDRCQTRRRWRFSRCSRRSKPRATRRGVRRRKQDHARRRFPGASLVLVEEFVPGQEYGVSGIVDREGTVRIVGVTERMIYRGHDESACLILRDVACPPEHAPSALRSVVESAIQALDLRSSPFDMDVRMPDRETALVIECGARITGGSVPACYRQIGIDFGELALSVVLGETVAAGPAARNGRGFCGQEYLVQGMGPQAFRLALPAGEMLAGERAEVIVLGWPAASGDYTHISDRFGIVRAVAASIDRVHEVLDLILLGDHDAPSPG